MTSIRCRHRTSCFSEQRGAVLIVALVLLLILSILGINSIRTTLLEEKMAAATYDRSLAFQAAEAALREGEAVAQAHVGNNGIVPNCNNGLCGQPGPNSIPRWRDPNFNGWVDATKDYGLAGKPQYFVEILGIDFPCLVNNVWRCSRYRITARSNPGTGRAAVMLQSIFEANTNTNTYRRVSWREIKQ